MLSIQELGTQILGANPGKFYVLGGSEYGVKEKYINILKNHYEGRMIECKTVDEIFSMMSTKHIIPLKPSLYVVRYDDAFVSELSDSTSAKIKKMNIIGTIVCVYEMSKHINKLDKYLPEYVGCIDSVSPKFVFSYLKSDFPNLSDRFIKLAVNFCENYSQAKNMCRCMDCAPESKLSSMHDSDIIRLFGCSDYSTELQIRKGVAARQFNYLISVVDKYPDSGDRILYSILQTMIELDKSLDNKRMKTDVQEYLRLWTREDVYYMFMNTYEELHKLRSLSSYNVNDSLIYLFGLLKFPRIPSPEVMNS